MNINIPATHHTTPTSAPKLPIQRGNDATTNTTGGTSGTQTTPSNPSHLGNFVDTTA
ncbi:hypothetical protein [Candidatus Burkholderia verschuerenii]|uniref:hypothetical protein n=1 Tax=Candidatus Burkholderia verschuerenii TaxID=242163 RepID=UPI000B0488D4|nr:hypothetical protein [Candidatus Burkholderia verschuerenii]